MTILCLRGWQIVCSKRNFDVASCVEKVGNEALNHWIIGKVWYVLWGGKSGKVLTCFGKQNIQKGSSFKEIHFLIGTSIRTTHCYLTETTCSES